MSLQNALLSQVIKVIVDNKDEYIPLIRDALLNFVKQIKVDGHDQSALDEITANLHEVAAKILNTYELLHALVDKYGHPEVKTK